MHDAYFAGLIDGEGYVKLEPRTGKKVGQFRIHIVVNMTCFETLTALHSRFGGSLKPKQVPTHNKPQWRWSVHCAQARAVLRAIEPYSITKRSAIDQCIEFSKTQGLW